MLLERTTLLRYFLNLYLFTCQINSHQSKEWLVEGLIQLSLQKEMARLLSDTTVMGSAVDVL